jgi:hypothetical protein
METNCDYLRIYYADPDDPEDRSGIDWSARRTYGPERLTGRGDSKNYPWHENPLIIPGDKFYLHFHTVSQTINRADGARSSVLGTCQDASATDWGYRFVAYPVQDYADPFTNPPSQSMVLETSHELMGGEEFTLDASLPGADAVEIRFHDLSALREGDEVAVCQGSGPGSSEEPKVCVYTESAHILKPLPA